MRREHKGGGDERASGLKRAGVLADVKTFHKGEKLRRGAQRTVHPLVDVHGTVPEILP